MALLKYMSEQEINEYLNWYFNRKSKGIKLFTFLVYY